VSRADRRRVDRAEQKAIKRGDTLMYFKRPAQYYEICTADGEPFQLREHRQRKIKEIIVAAKEKEKEKAIRLGKDAPEDDDINIRVDLSIPATFENMITFLLATGPYRTKEVAGKEVLVATWDHEDQMHVYGALRAVGAVTVDDENQGWYYMEKADYDWLVDAVKEEGPVVFRSAEVELFNILTIGAQEAKPE
jgi:hypothetical protein